MVSARPADRDVVRVQVREEREPHGAIRRRAGERLLHALAGRALGVLERARFQRERLRIPRGFQNHAEL